ncbi:hypothetical protein [Phenylobacterium sp.]|uniref:hypothetical protein n=1 Tax=Phenylobacterium sp. TaxID=1871053 RepID=UPI003BAC30EE
MRHKLALAGLGLAIVAFGPAQAADCRKGEQLIFSCAFKGKVASVCATPGQATYRYGRPGSPEIEIASGGGHAFQSVVIGGGGGSQTSLRFTNKGFNYIVSSGEQGSLHDAPGKTWSVLTILQDDKVVASRTCKLTSPWDRIQESGLPDDPDERFVAWY